MHVSLPNELEKAIKDEVSGGFYSSVSEFMREAARQLLRQPSTEQLEQIRKAVAIGIEASSKGEVVDANILHSELRETLKKKQGL